MKCLQTAIVLDNEWKSIQLNVWECWVLTIISVTISDNFKFSRITFFICRFYKQRLHFKIFLVFDARSYQIDCLKMLLFIIFLYSFRMVWGDCAKVVFDDHLWVLFTWGRRFRHIVDFGNFFRFSVEKFEIFVSLYKFKGAYSVTGNSLSVAYSWLCGLQGLTKVAAALKKCSCKLDTTIIWESFGIARNFMNPGFQRYARSVIYCPLPQLLQFIKVFYNSHQTFPTCSLSSWRK